MKPTIYFDYNATTPLDSRVREAMLPFLSEVFGNPSSVHHVGRRARACLDESRDRVARLLGCKPSELVFTSGGTESNNLAIFGVARHLRPKGRHLVTSAVEHHAVLHCCEYLARHEGFEVTYLPADREGFVDPADLKKAIRPDTILVSIMAANNEVGTIQPVGQLGAVCRDNGVLFHTDAVQWFGKEPVPGIGQFNADLVAVCSHKIHGPKGAGLLYIRSSLLPDPIIFGGAHENERRAGTENLAATVGFTDALERFIQTPVFPQKALFELTARLSSCLSSIEGVAVRSPGSGRLSNTIAFTVDGADSVSMLANLDLEGICASSGSACSSGSLNPSHVLLALGVKESLANSLVRFSLGRESTAEEVRSVCAILPPLVERTRKFSITS